MSLTNRSRARLVGGSRGGSRASRLRTVWLGGVVGLAMTAGLVLPGTASAISTHFTVTNASSHAMTLSDVVPPTKQDTPAVINTTSGIGRPPDGAVIEPGRSAGFELTYYFLSTNGARADFQVAGEGAVHVTMVQYGFGGVRTDCSSPGGAPICVGAGQDSASVTFVDPPGTVLNVPASLKQQQADALKALCATGNAATCSFTATKPKPEHLESEEHKVGGFVDNPHDYDETTTITLKDIVGTTDSIDVGVKAGAELFELVKAEVEVKYGHEWTQEHIFGQDVTLKIPAKQRCWFVATAPIIRYTGDFKVTLGNTTWNLTDVYFDGPDTDPSPPAANWGYTPKCIDLPPSTGLRAVPPGSRLVLSGTYRSPATAAIKRPRLRLAILGTSRLLPGASTAYRIVLSRRRRSQGLSYTPQHVRVRVRLGDRQLGRWRVGTLSAGRVRTIRVAVRPRAGSSRRVCLTATANAPNAIGARATKCLSISPSQISSLG